jgi:predicted exporter
VVFLVLFGVTRIPVVQIAMVQFSDSMDVNWVTDLVDFIVNGFWVLAIPVLIGTVVTLTRKPSFDVLNVYDTGIGFVDSKSQNERYAAYSDVELSYGRMHASFTVESKAASVKMANFGWQEFAESSLLRSNLERYGTWHR